MTAQERVLDDGRLHVPIQLRWGDLDSFNHVNNTSLLKMLEEARVRAFWKPAPGEEAPPTAILEPGLSSGVLTLLARQEVEYLAPVPYQRHPLDIQMWFSKLGGSSLEICYEVRSVGQTLYASATTVMVMVDAESGKPLRLTAEMRAAWQPLLGEPLSHRRH